MSGPTYDVRVKRFVRAFGRAIRLAVLLGMGLAAVALIVILVVINPPRPR